MRSIFWARDWFLRERVRRSVLSEPWRWSEGWNAFEMTAQGERPIAGASVIADFADHDFSNASVPAATTLTDTEGRYVLCNVRTGIGLIVTIAGFRQTSKGIDLARTSTYDFELTRTPASGLTPAR